MIFKRKKERKKEVEAPKLFEIDSEMEKICKTADEYKEYKRITKDANFFRHIAEGIEKREISVNSYQLEWGEGGVLKIELVNQNEISKVLKELFYG